MKGTRVAIALGALATVFAAGPAGAQPVSLPGLFNTGVDGAGNPLGDGAADPHYEVFTAALASLGPARVINAANVAGTWVPNDATSRWVWEGATGQPTNVTRIFRTTFDLTGYDPTTAIISGQWAVDNTGLDILINGSSTGNTSPGFAALTSFNITSGFVAGVNTLDFVANDFGVISGFRVAAIEGRASPLVSSVPEPATVALLGGGLLVLAGVARRRRAG